MPKRCHHGLRGIGFSSIFIHTLTKRLVLRFVKCQKDRSLVYPATLFSSDGRSTLRSFSANGSNQRWGIPPPSLSCPFTNRWVADHQIIPPQQPKSHRWSMGFYFRMFFKSVMDSGSSNHLFCTNSLDSIACWRVLYLASLFTCDGSSIVWSLLHQ